MAPHRHLVQFYENNEVLARTVGAYLGNTLARGERAVVSSTSSHRRAFSRELTEQGFDVRQLVWNRRMIFCNARETLAQFMVDGQPDPDLFEKAVGSIVRSFAAPSQSGLCVYGEMVDLLWNAGLSTAASRLEGLWNALLATNHFNSCAPIKSASWARNSSPGFSTTSCAPTPTWFRQAPANWAAP